MDTTYDILIVDDEAYIAAVLAEVLSEEGYSVHAVSDGASALRLIALHPPVLVLLDYMMPGLSGVDVLAQLRRSEHRHMPVIMMSAAGSAERFLQAGATAFFSKPFDFDELLACVRQQMPGQSAHALEYGGRQHTAAAHVSGSLQPASQSSGQSFTGHE